MPEQKVEPPTAEDRRAIEGEMALGRRICEFYLDESRCDAEAVDRAFALWLRDPREQKPSPNEIALGLGSLLGEHLCQEHGCQWVVVTDRLGCDLAVQHPETEWLFFCRHWVAKRLEPEEAGDGVFGKMIAALLRDGALGG